MGGRQASHPRAWQGGCPNSEANVFRLPGSCHGWDGFFRPPLPGVADSGSFAPRLSKALPGSRPSAMRLLGSYVPQ